MTPTERVHLAFATTRQILPGHLERCLTQRAAGPRAAGSTYILSTEALERALLGATWETYEHPAIEEDCAGFTAPIAGRLGVVALASLPPWELVTLDDPKGEGETDVLLRRRNIPGRDRVDFTVILLGPVDDTGASPHGAEPRLRLHEVVYTFHPGAPIVPARVCPTVCGPDGRTIRVDQALRFGFTHAKIVAG